MFRLQPHPTFTAEVRISAPGAGDKLPLRLTVRHQGREALRTWVDGFATRPEAELLGQVIVDWHDVVDPAGAPVAYSAARLAELLDAYPLAGREIFTAYLDAYGDAARKN